MGSGPIFPDGIQAWKSRARRISHLPADFRADRVKEVMPDDLCRSHRRAALIAGLRALASYLESNPDMPAPRFTDVMVFPADGTDAELRAEIDAIAARIGETPGDRRRSHHVVSRFFRPGPVPGGRHLLHGNHTDRRRVSTMSSTILVLAGVGIARRWPPASWRVLYHRNTARVTAATCSKLEPAPTLTRSPPDSRRRPLPRENQEEEDQ